MLRTLLPEVCSRRALRINQGTVRFPPCTKPFGRTPSPLLSKRIIAKTKPTTFGSNGSVFTRPPS